MAQNLGGNGVKEAFLMVYNKIGKVELWLAKAGVLIFTALIFLSAVARTMRQPQGWAQDWAMFVFVWCVFLSADACLREDKLVTVDILTCKFPARVNAYLKVFNLVLILIFLAFLVYYGVSLTYTSRFVRFQGVAYFSYSWVAASLPIGALLMFVTSSVKLHEHLALMRKTEKGGAR